MLKPKFSDKEKEAVRSSAFNYFRGIELIQWRANNLLDQQMMEALEEACEKLTPAQIMERLKV